LECACDIIQVEHFVRCNILLQIFVADLFENLAVMVEVVPRQIGFDSRKVALQKMEPAVEEGIEDVRGVKFQQT
jgi:hypothetical protein